MKGTVKRFDGRMGFAIGEDGNKYFMHVDFISKKIDNLNRAKKVLCKLKGQENKIEFDPVIVEGREHPEARNIMFDVSPRGWVPLRTKDTGFWFRDGGAICCSSCGHTSEHGYRYCPHCGVFMMKREE